MASLLSLGWSDFFAAQLTDEERARYAVARVVEEQKRFFFVTGADDAGPVLARISGKLRHAAQDRAALPAVGDWVVTEAKADGERRILRVLDRKSKLSRKAAGETTLEQVLCTNVDVAFVVASLDGELSVRRVERYLATVLGGGARAVVLLTKVDLCDEADAAAAITEVCGLSPGVEVIPVSVPLGLGLDEAAAHLGPGKTAVLLGSSGVGKSTIINHFAGSALRPVGDVRDWDGKGRHTTTARTLITLPNGALIIDTPGMRELAVWGDAATLKDSFLDVMAFAGGCRFRDCSHHAEPGCAVRAAVDSGALDSDRYDSYLSLHGEATVQSRRLDARARAEVTRRNKVATRALRARLRAKGAKD